MTDTTPTGFAAQCGIWAATRAYRAALLNPDSEIVREATSRKCDQCHAPAGELCVKRGGFGSDLKARLIHIGRMHKP